MKKIYTTLLSFLVPMLMTAQNITGWPANYGGVMLQGFYWDSFSDTQWTKLTSQADELAATFDLIWIPQSGNCGGTSMGYDDLYWFPGGNHYTSSFGTEQELRTKIQTFKNKGLGTIADVVVNHRKNFSNWVDFPAETYEGVTYQLKSTDIVGDDYWYDSNNTKRWTRDCADAQIWPLSQNNDTGEGWSGLRDLDHKSTNVQDNVKAYTKMLLNDLGYVGFRYDMTKGFWALFVKDYNNYAQPQFSVGEFWDGNVSKVKEWINYAENTSASFDFPFRYTVRDAINNNDWRKLGGTSLASDNDYRQYAVTFVENHDTERRSNAEQDPIRKDTLAANAYLLAMPGTPCVFMKHWIDYKQEISTMAAIRKAMGITNTSTTLAMGSTSNYYAVRTAGTNGNLLTLVGTTANSYTTNGNWTKIFKGHHFAYFVQNLTTSTPWIGLGSGTYDGEQEVLLTAISNDSNAKLVYTTNGSNPTTSSTQVASGTRIKIDQSCTLKVGVLTNGTVSNIISRTYTITDAQEADLIVNPGEVCAFFEAPTSWSSTIKCWAWDHNNGDVNYTGGSWPGVACTKIGLRNGKEVWKWTFKESDYQGTAGTATKPTHIIFSNNGSPQTQPDFEFSNGGYYNQSGLVEVIPVTGNTTVTVSDPVSRIYTLDGRLMPTTDVNALPRGIYIVNGRKLVR